MTEKDGSNTHPTVLVPWPDGSGSVPIDEEMAELVAEIWRAGWTSTMNTCQDVGETLTGTYWERPQIAELVASKQGRANLGFWEVDHCLDFIQAVTNAGPRDELYERIVHWASPGAWSCRLTLTDELDHIEPEPDWTRPSAIYPDGVSLSFPRTDLAEVTKRIKQHNAGQEGPHTEPSWTTVSPTAEEIATMGLDSDDLE